MRRVVVYGSSGSGKSTLATAAASRIGARHIEIDALAWRPDWSHATFEDLNRALDVAMAGERWVLEGMHRDQLQRGLALADTFVWLDVPRWLVASRLLRRSALLFATRRRRHGRQLTLGAFVRRELPFVRKTWRRFGDRRAHGAAFAEAARESGLDVVHLRSSSAARSWLGSLTPG